tara:strand:- start:134 stop:304 length:171 start_codon:yes stop_codon:yes gene_type:complete
MVKPFIPLLVQELLLLQDQSLVLNMYLLVVVEEEILKLVEVVVLVRLCIQMEIQKR